MPGSTTATVIANGGTAVLASGAPAASAGLLRISGSSGGSLVVAGGVLSNVATFLGETSNSFGSATVTSGTWLSPELYVGYFGTGSLTLSQGLVRAGTLSIGTNASGTGTVMLSGSNGVQGVLSASRVRKGNGTGTLIFDGGVLQARSNADDFLSGAASAPWNVTVNAGGATIDTNGFAVEASANLVGTGGLGKQGAGTLTLTGTNTYAGGTLVSGGTLAGPTSGLRGDIVNNAAVVFQGNSGTYAGAMSGTGTLTLPFPAGTFTLSGTNSYSGGTILSSGTLIGNSSSLQGNIVTGSSSISSVIFDQTVSGTYAGRISGSNAQLTKTGPGTLTVTGSNTVSATINSGTLVVAGGALTMNGSGLQVGTEAGKSASLVLDGGLVRNPNLSVATVAGSSGSVVINSGTLNATGGTTYIGEYGSGELTLNGGLLRTDLAAYIGFFTPGATGIATVNGGTWSNSSMLNVGFNERGTLNITGGLVSSLVTRTIIGKITLSGSAGARGTLAGVYLTGVDHALSSEELEFDGGVLQAVQNESNFIREYLPGTITIKSGGAYIDTKSFSIGIGTGFSGTGELVKIGSGTLTLSGSNSHSGGTRVDAGTLAVANNNALGTGDAVVNNGTLLIKAGYSATNKVILAGGNVARELGSGASLNRALNATSDLAGRPTTAALLDGVTSGSATIAATFSATAAGTNSAEVRSDVLHLSGIPQVSLGVTDLFVLELSMTSVESGSYLAWLNGEDEWVNAVSGNTGNNAAGEQLGYAGSFADFQLEYTSGLASYVGAWGHTDDGVWAVLNHNSDFAIVPEPSAMALITLTSVLALGRRRTGGARAHDGNRKKTQSARRIPGGSSGSAQEKKDDETLPRGDELGDGGGDVLRWR